MNFFLDHAWTIAMVSIVSMCFIYGLVLLIKGFVIHSIGVIKHGCFAIVVSVAAFLYFVYCADIFNHHFKYQETVGYLVRWFEHPEWYTYPVAIAVVIGLFVLFCVIFTEVRAVYRQKEWLIFSYRLFAMIFIFVYVVALCYEFAIAVS